MNIEEASRRLGIHPAADVSAGEVDLMFKSRVARAEPDEISLLTEAWRLKRQQVEGSPPPDGPATQPRPKHEIPTSASPSGHARPDVASSPSCAPDPTFRRSVIQNLSNELLRNPTDRKYQPGDVANGHMLYTDGVWRPLEAAPPDPLLLRERLVREQRRHFMWIWTHVLIFVGGLALTAISELAAEPGGRYVVFKGAIFFGAVFALVSTYRYWKVTRAIGAVKRATP